MLISFDNLEKVLISFKKYTYQLIHLPSSNDYKDF